MKSFKAGVAGLTLTTLFLAAVAAAQQPAAPAAPATPKPAAAPAKAAEPAAKPAAEAAAPKAGAVAKTIVGEVVEPGCYLVNGAKGEGHKECAMACAKAGQTLAILEKKTNKLYLTINGRPGDDPNKLLVDHIAQTVTVKGKVYTRGGIPGIVITSVEPGSAAR
jgi:nucleoid-associated protein YgaU